MFFGWSSTNRSLVHFDESLSQHKTSKRAKEGPCARAWALCTDRLWLLGKRPNLPVEQKKKLYRGKRLSSLFCHDFPPRRESRRAEIF
jgi:hypothetical protein